MPRRPRDPDILTARDVAAELGLALDSIYEGAARGDIPHRRVGQRLLFSRHAIRAWLHGDAAVHPGLCKPASQEGS